MKKPYSPRAGSLAERVIEHLQTHGGQLSPSDVLYTLPDVAPAWPDGESAVVAPPKAKRTGTRGAAGRRAAAKRRVVAAAPVEEEVASPIAAFWDDGDIVLHALQINGDDTATITVAHAQRLHAFLGRLFPTQTAEAA